MLIRFNVKNFLSFAAKYNGDSEEFSMIAGKPRNKKEHIYDDGKIKVLKFAAVYGANAAGKSNLVKAMNFMRETIILGLPKGCTEKYCKINPDNKDKESYFELEILLGGKYYAYGFEVILNQGRFISEWLVELGNDNSERILFERDIENGTYELGSVLKKKNIYEKVKNYAEDVKNDNSALFLSIMNQNKKNLYDENKEIKILKNIFLWLVFDFSINFPNNPISNYSYMTDESKLEEVLEIISAFGTGINKFRIAEVQLGMVLNKLPKVLQDKILSDIEERQIKLRVNDKEKNSIIIMRSEKDFFIIDINKDDVLCKTIEFSHEKKDVFFRLEEESDGTIRILDLIEILLSGSGKTFVVDELDRCLHPALTYKFISTFFKIAKEKNIQLIVTTHESRLLDFGLLRRDEIWFVNKKKNGESDIYSLEEYNARFDLKIDRAYLEGRYGGVPIFNAIFPIEGE